MFNVKSKETNETFCVFSVNKYWYLTEFLIYRNNKWEWVESDEFEPVPITYRESHDIEHTVLKIGEDSNNA